MLSIPSNWRRYWLKETLDELDADECWQSLNRRESGVSKWTMARLTDYECTSEPKEPETNPQLAIPPLNPEAPPPPRFLRISVPLDSAVTIADRLTALGNGDLLTQARRATNQYDFKIY